MCFILFMEGNELIYCKYGVDIGDQIWRRVVEVVGRRDKGFLRDEKGVDKWVC